MRQSDRRNGAQTEATESGAAPAPTLRHLIRGPSYTTTTYMEKA